MRTVSELMQLGTYQGMTDEEIESIIDYVFVTARTEGESAALASAQMQMSKELHEAKMRIADMQMQQLKSFEAQPVTIKELKFA